MPKFFFSIEDGSLDKADKIGTDLPDVESVRGEAIRAAGEMLADADGALDGEEWKMTVMDEAGKVILRLQFSAVGGEDA